MVQPCQNLKKMMERLGSEGFQVIEEFIFPAYNPKSKAELRKKWVFYNLKAFGQSHRQMNSQIHTF
jgi:hypothetical protein